ncbi:hypothetical protein AAHA92_00634 [Salvia divinorum]|uniref:Uncharacterized protein n=1 Tax=Salvia divinorum TaxID=28513 RepID=A0ABD1IK79_SALDI
MKKTHISILPKFPRVNSEPFFPKISFSNFRRSPPQISPSSLSSHAEAKIIQIPKLRHREVIGLSSGGVVDSPSSPAAAAARDRPHRAPLPLPSVTVSRSQLIVCRHSSCRSERLHGLVAVAV